MLTGYKSWIGIGIWAVGAIIGEFFGGTSIAAFGPPLMDFGQLVFAGGMVSKAVRFMRARGIE